MHKTNTPQPLITSYINSNSIAKHIDSLRRVAWAFPVTVQKAVVFAGITIAVTCCGRKEPAVSTDSFASIRETFLNPDHKFASAPLWVWNADVNEDMIRTQLTDLKEAGFGGVFIHPRAGLITPYASDRWYALCAYTLQEAKTLGMDVWIYDENSYPSGFAGGRVPDAMPESFNKGQMLEIEKRKQLPEASTDAIALKKEGDHFIDITSQWKKFEGKPGEYVLFHKTFYNKSDWYGGFSYVDLMQKGVTEKFIERTMAGYEKVFGADFGGAVPGIFSDEPNIETQRANNIRWTPDLFERFNSTWGYRLEPNLVSLFEETGDWRKVRHNYRQTLLQLFIDRWSKPYNAYTEKKKLEWTGHYWEHEWPSPNLVPDNMAMYAWHQRPAIDMLFNQFNEESPHAQFGNVRSVKELSSIANQLNKKRTLSETYGGAGWEVRLRDLKRLGDWEFVLGVNTLNQHLSHMTIMGARKYDYPQSFSYHNPWFRHYKKLNDYFTRLTRVITSGRQQNRIVVIEPTTSAWMYYNRDHSNARFEEIGNQFQAFVTRLEKMQIEYDLASENVIKDHGSTKDSTFIIGSSKYTTVILPPGLENLDHATFELIRKYSAAGGKVIQFNTVRYVDGAPHEMLKEFHSKPGARFYPVDSLNPKGLEAELLEKDFHISVNDSSGGNLYHHRRHLEDGQVLFLTNSSLENSSEGVVDIPGATVAYLDLMTGNISEYTSEHKGEISHFKFQLPPAGSAMYFISNSPVSGLSPYNDDQPAGTTIDTPTEVTRLSDNSLPIDFCSLTVDNVKLVDTHVYNATDTLFKLRGFANGNPWNTSVQYKDNTLARDTFKTGSGFKVEYSFTAEGLADIGSIRVVIEQPALYRVEVNGKAVQPVAGEWWLDKSFGVFAVGPFIHPGENSIRLTADRMNVRVEIEPIYILGNFSVENASHGWVITPAKKLELSSWRTQGMPTYGNTVGYVKKIAITSTGAHYAVELGQWEGTACAVIINGQPAGDLSYPPYRLDITPFVKEGDNTIEVDVVGSLKNVLGPFHKKPRPGLVSPWHFRYVTSYPAGKDYDLLDYGLMEDFRLVQTQGK